MAVTGIETNNFADERHDMKCSNRGFTLIELIVVITILAILAAVAIPKFAALQTDARIAKMNAALGSIKAGAVLARSIQLTQQLGPNTTVKMEGVDVTMVNGYPAASSITIAAGVTSPDFEIGAPTATAGVNQIVISSDQNHPNCSITYIEAALGNAPGYTAPLDPSDQTTRQNCS